MIPRAMYMLPRVTISGGMLNRVMTNPLSAPIAAPDSTPPRMLSQIGMPETIISPAIMPPRPMMEPMDRSMWPEIRMNVSPTAAMMVSELARSRLIRLVGYQKEGL